MNVRSLMLVAGRFVAVAVALALLLLTPAVIEGPAGRSYEPVGIAIDLAALIVLVLVAWTALRRRARENP